MHSQPQLTTLSTKGQVIIPKNIRHQCHWESGQKLTIITTEEGVLLRAQPLSKTHTLEAVAGCLSYAGQTKSIEDMAAAIRQGAKDSHDRR